MYKRKFGKCVSKKTEMNVLSISLEHRDDVENGPHLRNTGWALTHEGGEIVDYVVGPTSYVGSHMRSRDHYPM